MASEAKITAPVHMRASQGEKAAIDHAVTLWRAMHRETSPVDPWARGETLAAICAEWVAGAMERLGPTKGA